MSQDMYGDMTGPSAWMMRPSWSGAHLALLFAMWAAMMIGMMLPSAAPALLIYGMVARRGDGAADAPLRVHILDRKSTRLNSSYSQISYAVFCLKKKKKKGHSYLSHP